MSSMKIESLHVKNVRQFHELDVLFNDKFNFIVGPNACGKTSILTCISHCFYHANFEYSRFKTDSEFWTNLILNGEKYRIGLAAGSLDSRGYRNTSITTWNAPPLEPGRTSIVLHEVPTKLKTCPLFIGSQRGIKYRQIQGMQREEDVDRKFANHIQNITKAIYGDSEPSLKQWFINRYFMIDKEWAHEERKNWEHLLSGLPGLAPFNSDFRYVRTGKDLEPIFSVYGSECYLEELSSGFQTIFLIVANIFEWVEGSMPEGSRSVVDATGTVLIDELDLHLHPEWQLSIRDGLVRIFPNIQFIVTTHSPHLLASAKPDEVIVMPKNYINESYSLSPTHGSFSGWNTDQILQDIMGVDGLENKDLAKLIKDAFSCIEAKNIDGLADMIGRLSSICHPGDSIITVLTARLAALRALSDD